MPTFVPDGPFVPDQLVQQLEDDRVVIFCGAGISMGAGLPSYRGLVKYCYEELGETLPARKSTEWLWPDRLLGAIENRFTPEEIRRKVSERLNRTPTDLALHRAILKLAAIRRRNGLRLVTTNYDTFFEQAQAGLLLGRDFHSGPVLPIPRNDRIASWKSIVYLHGRLAPADESNDHLVLTSADFGRAYLTDAWAARFVTRLFADFTVLFIGYSLNDPVLRYMTDAFAAEEGATLGRTSRGPAYIFLPFTERTPRDPRPWIERKLEPIFYNQMRRHIQLKRTLIAWAEARRDYLSNTRVMIERVAPSRPELQHPSAVENLIWAVAGRPNDAGHGARVFAGLPHPAPIQWLSVLEKREKDQADAYDRAVHYARREDRALPVAPIGHLESLFPSVLNENGGVAATAHALIPWLTRQLNSIDFVEWVIEKRQVGRKPHAVLRHAIRDRLANGDALAEGYMRFWRIISAEGSWAFKRPRSFERSDLPTLVRAEPDAPWTELELADALRPVLTLSPAWRSGEGLNPAVEGSQLSQIADAKVKLTEEDYLPAILEAIDALPNADAFWAERLDLLTELLRETFDLYAVAGEANLNYDPSAFQRPSIVPHAQNHNYERWTMLFDLIWRGWCHVDVTNSKLSLDHIARWRRMPFLGFRRLALAAIGRSSHLTPQEKLEALFDG